MRKTIYFILPAIFLGGCTPTTATFDAYGNEAYTIQCHWTTEKKCYAKAEKICPQGYYLSEEDMNSSLLGLKKSLTIRCK